MSKSITSKSVRDWLANPSSVTGDELSCEIFAEMLKRCPEDVTGYAKIGRNARGDGIILISEDGSKIRNISFRRALGETKRQTPESRFKTAARSVVRDQTVSFRNSSSEEEAKFSDGKAYHVGHVGNKNEFRHILNDWCVKEYGSLALAVQSVKLTKVSVPGQDFMDDVFKDENVANSWSAFHLERATLKMQEAEENLKAPRTPKARGRPASKPMICETCGHKTTSYFNNRRKQAKNQEN